MPIHFKMKQTWESYYLAIAEAINLQSNYTKKNFLTNPNRSNEFYAKVFGQYGDESISESVSYGFAVCFEKIPTLWST